MTIEEAKKIVAETQKLTNIVNRDRYLLALKILSGSAFIQR